MKREKIFSWSVWRTKSCKSVTKLSEVWIIHSGPDLPAAAVAWWTILIWSRDQRYHEIKQFASSTRAPASLSLSTSRSRVQLSTNLSALALASERLRRHCVRSRGPGRGAWVTGAAATRSCPRCCGASTPAAPTSSRTWPSCARTASSWPRISSCSPSPPSTSRHTCKRCLTTVHIFTLKMSCYCACPHLLKSEWINWLTL